MSRSTAHRYWPTQEQFHEDVLSTLMGSLWQGTAAFDAETIGQVTRVVTERISDLATAEGRRATFREAIRVGVTRNFAAITGSVEWRTYVALAATMLSRDRKTDRGSSARRIFEDTESALVSYMVEFYEDMAVVLGFRTRYAGGFSVLAGAGAAAIEGLALRQILTPELVDQTFVVEGPSGTEQWGLPALCFLGVADALVEPVADYDPEAALAEYFRRVSSRAASGLNR